MLDLKIVHTHYRKVEQYLGSTDLTSRRENIIPFRLYLEERMKADLSNILEPGLPLRMTACTVWIIIPASGLLEKKKAVDTF